MTPPHNFDARLDKAWWGTFALIGFPYDEKSSYLRGQAEAPGKIRDALNCPSSNFWTELGIDLGQSGILSDLGDLDFSLEEPFAKMEESISLMLEKGLRPIVLGGDHSVTYPVVKALGRRYKKLNILDFDAHPDLYDEFEGDRYSHACPFARIMEERLVSRLVQVGIRTMNGHQRRQAERFGVEVIEMREFRENLALVFESPVYISFDMDALDPAFAPGVSHHEPGGLSTRQAIQMIQTITAKIVGADIVELNPGRDPLGMTAMAAAKILKEIAGKCRKVPEEE